MRQSVDSATCQYDHWRRGHEDDCERISRGGGAEQYNADAKYDEAVAVAVDACAADTMDTGATLDELREAVTTLQDAERIARRVMGGTHPITESVEVGLLLAQAKLRSRED